MIVYFFSYTSGWTTRSLFHATSARVSFIRIITISRSNSLSNSSSFRAINYGTTGFVIGHELSHSFDNEGTVLWSTSMLQLQRDSFSNYFATPFTWNSSDLLHLGIQFNTEGYKTAWVSEEVFDEYEERAECFVEQYDNYTLDVKDKHGHHVKVNFFVNTWNCLFI